VVAAGVVVCLVMLLGQSGGTSDARSAAATAGAGSPAADPPAARTPQTPSTPSPAKKSPTPSKTPKTPKATAGKTPAAKPRPATRAPSAASGSGPLTGRIRPGTTYSGVATAYDAADGNGACLYGPSSDLMIAAMNHTDYETSKACGAYVRVHAAGGASITVRITNECPLPCAPGQLELSTQAFAKLAELSRGRIPITWELLSPDMSQTLSIRYKTGSSRYWCGIQVLGHRNPVARLEVSAGGGWRQLARTEYNYFLSEDGTGCGGAIRVTDIYGERLTVDGLAVRPNVVQPTRVQFARH
jgi:expansin